MTSTPVMAPSEVREWIGAVLRGADPGAPPGPVADILAACEDEDVTPLVSHLSRSLASYPAWPDQLRSALESAERAAVARELAVRAELVRALDAVGSAGVPALLLKGAALAYSLYESPSHRGRADTDLLVRPADVARAQAALAAAGYRPTPYSAGEELFGQAPLLRRDEMGLEHWIDLHWALSAARPFADTLDFDELDRAAAPVPALGPHARAPGHVHALLLACMHPVMHHRNAERLVWIYDIDRLARGLNPAGWSAFVGLVQAKRLRAVATRGLVLAIERMGTSVPAEVALAVAPTGDLEPTAEYLASGRNWLDELRSNLEGRASWRSRLTLVREIAFPRPSYLFASYGVATNPLRWIMLPGLYAHRSLRGIWRVARGRK